MSTPQGMPLDHTYGSTSSRAKGANPNGTGKLQNPVAKTCTVPVVVKPFD
jgi:hypothetical protein